jgi:hypothetical protein
MAGDVSVWVESCTYLCGDSIPSVQRPMSPSRSFQSPHAAHHSRHASQRLMEHSVRRRAVRTVRARRGEWVRVVRPGAAGTGSGSLWLIIGGLLVACCALQAIVTLVSEHWIVIVLLVAAMATGRFLWTSR